MDTIRNSAHPSPCLTCSKKKKKKTGGVVGFLNMSGFYSVIKYVLITLKYIKILSMIFLFLFVKYLWTFK